MSGNDTFSAKKLTTCLLDVLVAPSTPDPHLTLTTGDPLDLLTELAHQDGASLPALESNWCAY